MGNLLLIKDSFVWPNNLEDRNTMIDALSIALDEAREFGDTVFTPEGFYEMDLAWGDFCQVIWGIEFDSEERRRLLPWISQTTFQALQGILIGTTTTNSQTVFDLAISHIGENTGGAGIYCNEGANQYVHNSSTWNDFHWNYVKGDSPTRNTNFQYFIKFYREELLIDANIIRGLIQRNQTHRLILRLDVPPLQNGTVVHNQKIHLHFSDANECALNIDGTWRHREFNIPGALQVILKQWGFILPHERFN